MSGLAGEKNGKGLGLLRIITSRIIHIRCRERHQKPLLMPHLSFIVCPVKRTYGLFGFLFQSYYSLAKGLKRERFPGMKGALNTHMGGGSGWGGVSQSLALAPPSLARD